MPGDRGTMSPVACVRGDGGVGGDVGAEGEVLGQGPADDAPRPRRRRARRRTGVGVLAVHRAHASGHAATSARTGSVRVRRSTGVVEPVHQAHLPLGSRVGGVGRGGGSPALRRARPPRPAASRRCQGGRLDAAEVQRPVGAAAGTRSQRVAVSRARPARRAAPRRPGGSPRGDRRRAGRVDRAAGTAPARPGRRARAGPRRAAPPQRRGGHQALERASWRPAGWRRARRCTPPRRRRTGPATAVRPSRSVTHAAAGVVRGRGDRDRLAGRVEAGRAAGRRRWSGTARRRSRRRGRWRRGRRGRAPVASSRAGWWPGDDVPRRQIGQRVHAGHEPARRRRRPAPRPRRGPPR